MQTTTNYLLKKPDADDYYNIDDFMRYLENKLSNVNLIDNWDFRNPVNQRGLTKYNSSSNKGYTIDRWFIDVDTNAEADAQYLSVEDGYISLGEGVTTFRERIAGLDISGKTVTFSLKFLDGSVYSCSGTLPEQPEEDSSYILISSNFDFGRMTVGQNMTSGYTYVQLAKTSGVLDIVAAKLEYGDKSTIEYDNCSDYFTEYLKCLKYFYYGKIIVSYIKVSNITDEKYYLYGMQFPVKMRVKPTITLPEGVVSTSVTTPISATEYGITLIVVKSVTGVSGGSSGVVLPPAQIKICASAEL